MNMQPSLLRNLMVWALGSLLLVWATFIAVGYRTGLHEADELTDGHLASVAALLLAQRGGEFSERGDPARLAAPGELRNHDYQQSLSVVVWDSERRVVTRTGQAPMPAYPASEGFMDLRLGDPPSGWRAFARADPGAAPRLVMVLLSEHERDALAGDIAGQVMEPGMWLLPVVALTLALAIRRGLRPLHDLTRDVAALDVNQPQPRLQAHRQQEFAAVVEAIDLLVGRYRSAMARERDLASELAHEMRTPLAALTLHARTLRDLPEGAAREAAIRRVEAEALRAGQVLSDLLAMARASRAELDEATQDLDLHELAREVVAGHGAMAAQTGHELSLAAPGPMPVRGHPMLLEMALRNLVENALAHTPRGTLVEVQLDPLACWLQVCDNAAAATSPAERPAQGGAGPLGLGLGHRVVQKIAAVHGGRFDRVPAPAGFTSCYRLSLRCK